MISIFHPEFHPFFEALGYLCGFQLYRRARQKQGDFLTEERRWSLIAAAALGALVGSRILGVLEQAPLYGFHWRALLAPGGKTIVGGLLGGWLAVELAKLATGVRTRTGDLYAVPICIGIAIGRIGCFLAGLPDDTYGTATTLPWGVDFGDGVRRHPTQIYELLFLLLLAAVLTQWGKQPHRQGIIFRAFLAAYLAWRFLIDFLKPQPTVFGLNWIQWACLFGVLCLGIAEIRIGMEQKDV